MKSRWQRFREWAHDWWGADNTPMSIEEYWDAHDPADALMDESDEDIAGKERASQGSSW